MIKRTWFLALGFMSSMALAEIEAAEPNAQHWNASVCSLVASDGKWQLYHSDFGIHHTCQVALQGLTQRTGAPVTGNRTFFVRYQGFNTIRLNCWGYSNVFMGQGLEPLYRAYNLAWGSQLAYCRFSN